MKCTLKIWPQKDAVSKGELTPYCVEGTDRDMSFLEMLDVLNAGLIDKDERPVDFYHDCREGICGNPLTKQFV